MAPFVLVSSCNSAPRDNAMAVVPSVIYINGALVNRKDEIAAPTYLNSLVAVLILPKRLGFSAVHANSALLCCPTGYANFEGEWLARRDGVLEGMVERIQGFDEDYRITMSRVRFRR